MRCTITVFTLTSLLAGPTAFLLGSLYGGVIAGVLLAFWGLHLTTFETNATVRFYTPNPIMGIGLSMLLAARLIYRLVVYNTVLDQNHPQPRLLSSPLTLFLFGLLAGYYIAYFIGLLLHDEKPAALA